MYLTERNTVYGKEENIESRQKNLGHSSTFPFKNPCVEDNIWHHRESRMERWSQMLETKCRCREFAAAGVFTADLHF